MKCVVSVNKKRTDNDILLYPVVPGIILLFLVFLIEAMRAHKRHLQYLYLLGLIKSENFAPSEMRLHKLRTPPNFGLGMITLWL